MLNVLPAGGTVPDRSGSGLVEAAAPADDSIGICWAGGADPAAKGSGLIHHGDRGSQPGVRGFAAPIHATAETAGPSTAGRLRVRSLLGGGEGGQFAVDR
ncbi:hypothetical protein GCM10010317_102010 [Streptomyces mirabilis]|nr:hypothetical protein GCM10010317_102010 [Streptomyces mirabilis]